MTRRTIFKLTLPRLLLIPAGFESLFRPQQTEIKSPIFQCPSCRMSLDNSEPQFRDYVVCVNVRCRLNGQKLWKHSVKVEMTA